MASCADIDYISGIDCSDGLDARYYNETRFLGIGKIDRSVPPKNSANLPMAPATQGFTAAQAFTDRRQALRAISVTVAGDGDEPDRVETRGAYYSEGVYGCTPRPQPAAFEGLQQLHERVMCANNSKIVGLRATQSTGIVEYRLFDIDFVCGTHEGAGSS